MALHMAAQGVAEEGVKLWCGTLTSMACEINLAEQLIGSTVKWCRAIDCSGRLP